MQEKVIDLSQWNEIMYDKLYSDDLHYAILKAINKSNLPDGKFEKHYAGCNAVGIEIIGTYHYSYATTVIKARTSANAWLKAVNGRCKMFWLDWEDSSLPKDSRALDIILAYADVITSAGYQFGIYCSLSWYNSYLKKYADKLPYPFWIARYPSSAIMDDEQDPNAKYKPQIANTLYGWQYTSKGRVDGASNVVDFSVWYTDLKEQKTDSNIVVSASYNPYTEPTANVKLGTIGNDANWVLWYLWRFGKLVDADGKPDFTRLNGMIQASDVVTLKEVQALLGLTADGICGKITRSVFKKIC